MNQFYRDVFLNLLKIHSLRSLRPTPIMFTANDVDRGYVFEDKMYSQLIDSVADLIGTREMNCVTVATPFSRVVGKKAYGNVLAFNGKFARAYLYRFLQRKILFMLRRATSCCVTQVWTQIIKRIQPKLIIGIQPGKELCVSARMLGIPVFDLQHGVLSDEGYYGRAYRQDMDQRGWPDGFLCWDEESAAWAKKNCIGGRAIVAGNPWISRFIYPQDSDRLVTSAISKLSLTDRAPKVLVTLTWGLGLYCANPSPLGVAQEVIDTILSRKIDCYWLLRLHPMQLQGNRGEEMLCLLKKTFGHMPNVEWEITSRAPLPLILQKIDLHLTCMSSVILEAVRFGIKSGVVFADADLVRQWYGPQLDQGWATLISPKKIKIEEWLEGNLRSNLKDKTPSQRPFEKNMIFQLAIPKE